MIITWSSTASGHPSSSLLVTHGFLLLRLRNGAGLSLLVFLLIALLLALALAGLSLEPLTLRPRFPSLFPILVLALSLLSSLYDLPLAPNSNHLPSPSSVSGDLP